MIVLSSLGQRERDASFVAAFLTKPVKPRALREAVEAAVHGTAAKAAPTVPRGFATDRELAARHPLRILLAEDNAFNVKLAVRLLERMGYDDGSRRERRSRRSTPSSRPTTTSS